MHTGPSTSYKACKLPSAAHVWLNNYMTESMIGMLSSADDCYGELSNGECWMRPMDG